MDEEKLEKLLREMTVLVGDINDHLARVERQANAMRAVVRALLLELPPSAKAPLVARIRALAQRHDDVSQGFPVSDQDLDEYLQAVGIFVGDLERTPLPPS